jgi:hypothetical protein
MSAVWVAELDFSRPGSAGSWMGVHETRDGARQALAEYAKDCGLADLWPQVLAQDISTADEVSSSALVKDGNRELTYVINRHLVQP